MNISQTDLKKAASTWAGSNWFSNMLPLDIPLVYDGDTYLTSENFYQAMKIDTSRLDAKQRRREISLMSSHQSKACFRKEPSIYYVRPDWTAGMKLRYMSYILNWKFCPETSWYWKLLETKDEPIVEFNNWGDTFWGYDVRKHEGQNHLGRLLMEIRAKHSKTALQYFMEE